MRSYSAFVAFISNMPLPYDMNRFWTIRHFAAYLTGQTTRHSRLSPPASTVILLSRPCFWFATLLSLTILLDSSTFISRRLRRIVCRTTEHAFIMRDAGAVHRLYAVGRHCAALCACACCHFYRQRIYVDIAHTHLQTRTRVRFCYAAFRRDVAATCAGHQAQQRPRIVLRAG